MGYKNEYELLRAVKARKALDAAKRMEEEAAKAEILKEEEKIKEEVKEELHEDKKQQKKVKRTNNKEFLVEEKEQPKLEENDEKID